MDRKELNKKIEDLDRALAKHKAPREAIAPHFLHTGRNLLWASAISVVSHMLAGVALGYVIDFYLCSSPKALAICALLSSISCVYDIARSR